MDNSMPKSDRCGLCGACKRVEVVKQQAMKAFAQADVKRFSSGVPYSVGEDVRLIWNITLEENPCESN